MKGARSRGVAAAVALVVASALLVATPASSSTVPASTTVKLAERGLTGSYTSNGSLFAFSATYPVVVAGASSDIEALVNKAIRSTALGNQTYSNLTDLPHAAPDPSYDGNSNIDSVSWQPRLTSDRFVSFILDDYGFEVGAAHGSAGATGYTVDLQSGALLKDKDIFLPDASLADVLAPGLDQQITAKCGPDEFTDAASAINQDQAAYTLGPDGVDVTFQEYAVSAYACGQPETVQPYSNAWKVLKPDILTGLGLDAHGAPLPQAPPLDSPTCHADASLNAIWKQQETRFGKIAIPSAGINLPLGIPATASVSFQPGTFALCKNAYTAGFSSPGIFAGAEMSLDAADGAHKLGPFTYDAPTVSWLPNPDIPQGQTLTTKFDPAGVDAEVNPSLSVDWTRSGASPSIQAASVTLKALNAVVTLAHNGAAILQASIGPEIEIDVGISVRDIEREVAQREAEGESGESSVVDATDEAVGNAAVAANDEAVEFYDLDISSPLQAMTGSLSDELIVALDADPEVAALAPPASDAFDGTDVSSGDAAFIDDGAAAGDAIDFSVADDFLLFFL